MMPMELVGLYAFSYLIGSIPTAYLVGRLVKHVDIRDYGSGNVGGSNLSHHVGKRWTVPQCLLDVVVKGSVPVWIGLYGLGLDATAPLLVVVPLLAILGHNWSIYLKFQGGRGIAVVFGTLLALAPLLLAAFVMVALGGWAITRSAGVWVLISLLLLPFWVMLMPSWAVVGGDRLVIGWFCGGLVGLIVLKRLLSNWTPLYKGLPRKKVLFNRLFRDRDIDDRTEWVETGRIETRSERPTES
jgi:glycerol-3-phosphate acyltransferase PlsY